MRISGAMSLVCVIAVAGANLTFAQEYQAGPITVDQVWARPTVGGVTSTSVYMKLSNTGNDADRLLVAKT